MKLDGHSSFKRAMVAGVLFFTVGCSGSHVKAKYYLYRAGQSFYETDNKLRRIQKMPFDARKPFYRNACDYYLKAYKADRHVFNLEEIEHALQSCESADVTNAAILFQQFEAAYEKKHPVEADYGMISGAAVSEG